MRLRVLAEVDGARREVGTIETVPGYGERFSYSAEWLSPSCPGPLSLSLPVSGHTYTAAEMRPYFEGLLPEGDVRSSVAADLGVSSRSYVSLLRALGDECTGALMILEEGAASGQDPARYTPLTVDELGAIVSRGYAGASQLLIDSRLSIAGAQAKIGLYRSAEGGDQWYVPHATAPATHVIKPASDRFEGIVANECLCLLTARKCGLPVPNAYPLGTEYPAIVVERYDRRFFGDEPSTGGLPMPSRLHQEDLCQALGILPDDKYGSRAMGSIGEIAQLLRMCSADPIADLGALWDALAFNYLVGNCDDHIKNLSLLRSRDWSALRLAPFYDIVCTSVYAGLTRAMGMKIGSARHIDRVTREDFHRLAADMGVSGAAMFGRFDHLRSRFEDAFLSAADELAEGGCPGVSEMRDRVLADVRPRIEKIGK